MENFGDENKQSKFISENIPALNLVIKEGERSGVLHIFLMIGMKPEKLFAEELYHVILQSADKIR